MVVFPDVVIGVVASAVLQNVQHLCAKLLQWRWRWRGEEKRDRKSFLIGHSIFSADTSITHIKIDVINLPPLVVHQNLKRFLYLHMIRWFPCRILDTKVVCNSRASVKAGTLFTLVRIFYVTAHYVRGSFSVGYFRTLSPSKLCSVEW